MSMLYVGDALDAPVTGRTRVRYRHTAGSHRGWGDSGWPQVPPVAMEWLTVLLPPLAPDYSWDCGTPIVWRVDVAEYGLPPVGGCFRCVCIHQIEAD